jgi:hypothetical protein
MATYWTKPRIVFLVWAIVELIGWLSTHFFFMDPRANWVWLVLSVIAFVPMVKYMPWRNLKLRKILILWIVVVAVGMAISFLTFSLSPLYPLAPNLGIFWLFLMGVAFLVNALWWTPELFIIGGVLQIAAGALPLLVPSLLFYQYLIAAVAGTGAMLILLPNRRLK